MTCAIKRASVHANQTKANCNYQNHITMTIYHKYSRQQKPTNNRKQTKGRTKKFKVMHAPSFNANGTCRKMCKRLSELSGIRMINTAVFLVLLKESNMTENFSPVQFRKMYEGHARAILNEQTSFTGAS